MKISHINSLNLNETQHDYKTNIFDQSVEDLIISAFKKHAGQD